MTQLFVFGMGTLFHQIRVDYMTHCLKPEWIVGTALCMQYEVEGPRPRSRPMRTWREVMEKDCQAHKLNKEDAMDCSRWRMLIKDVWWSGWVWVGEWFFWYRLTWVVADKGPKTVVCVFGTAPVITVLRSSQHVHIRSMLIIDFWMLQTIKTRNLISHCKLPTKYKLLQTIRNNFFNKLYILQLHLHWN